MAIPIHLKNVGGKNRPWATSKLHSLIWSVVDIKVVPKTAQKIRPSLPPTIGAWFCQLNLYRKCFGIIMGGQSVGLSVSYLV